MASQLRSLTYVGPRRAFGVAGAEPGEGLAEYMKNFARLIPGEAMTAFATLIPLTAGLSAGVRGGVSVAIGWACLVGAALFRLATSSNPVTGRRNWVPALGAAVAFALYVYAQGGSLGFGSSVAQDERRIIAGIVIGLYAAFAPAVLPLLARKP